MKVNKYVNVVAPSLEPDKEGILNIKFEPSGGNWVENYCIIKENYMFCFKEHPALCENSGTPRSPSGRGMLQQMSEASLKTLGLAQSFAHNDDRCGKPIVFPLEEAQVSAEGNIFTIWHDEPQGTGCFFKAQFKADEVHVAAAWARHIQAGKSSIQKGKLQLGMVRNKQMVEDMAKRVKTLNKKHQEQQQLQRVLDAERSLYVADASNGLAAGSPPEPQLMPFLSLPEKTSDIADPPQSTPSTSKTPGTKGIEH
eukprot:gene2426-3156_t